MPRALFSAVGMLCLVGTARADDSLTPEMVGTIKSASVYIRVEGTGWSGSGSGFVVSTDKGQVLVVTNHHVAVRAPAGMNPKAPKISVVFGSGTAGEKEYPATVVGSDDEHDLAVLRVTDVKDAPKSLNCSDLAKPVETMNVFSFGYPLGQALSVGKGYPSVTVGKASISSLRAGDDGELARIQIDGNLNPGNSGGAVVDSKGRLVGVAVARAREGQGIGFLIPAAEVARMMAGRVGRVRVVSGKGSDGKPTARVVAELVDPANRFQSATAHYVIVPAKEKIPDITSLEKHAGARKLALKTTDGVAAGEIAIEKAEGTILVQVVLDRGAATEAVVTRTKVSSLAPGAKAEDIAGPPPPGWKEYTDSGKVFTLWVPEKPAQQDDAKRNVTVLNANCRATGVAGKTSDGLSYRAEVIELPPQFARPAIPGPGAFRNPFKMFDAYRATLADETKGQITDSISATCGNMGGNECRYEEGKVVTRVRFYIQGARIYAVRVVGAADQVAGAEAETILISFRRPGDIVTDPKPETTTPSPPKPKPEPTDPSPKNVADSTEPYIFGTIAHDPKFKTEGPAGALLIGVEARFGKFGDTQIVRAVRPIYRVKGEEEFGKQFGDDLKESVTLKAKAGYAVGGMTAKSGWWCNGFSFTFMKVKEDGTLDPKESYESDWVGFNGKSEVFKVMSDGVPAIGIVGKIVGKETTALGLLFKERAGGAVKSGPAKPEDFIGQWTRVTDGLTELWTIACKDGEWEVFGVFLDGEKEVGNFVGEKPKMTEQGVEFVQKYGKNPPRVWLSGASYTTKLEDGKLSYTWRIAGASGTRIMTKVKK